MTTPKNGPIQEIADEAQAAREKYPGARTWQKWTCAHCGARQIMAEPDVFYASGRCGECGAVSTITHCGFSLAIPQNAATAAALRFHTRPPSENN